MSFYNCMLTKYIALSLPPAGNVTICSVVALCLLPGVRKEWNLHSLSVLLISKFGFGVLGKWNVIVLQSFDSDLELLRTYPTGYCVLSCSTVTSPRPEKPFYHPGTRISNQDPHCALVSHCLLKGSSSSTDTPHLRSLWLNVSEAHLM